MVGRPETPRDDLPPLGRCIRDERKKKGMSRADLAQATAGHYKESTIRGIETGSTVPSPLGIRRLCNALPDVANELLELFRTDTIDPNQGLTRRSGRLHFYDAGELAGQWYGIWQTLRNGGLAIVLEQVDIATRPRSRFEIENRDGAKWLALDQNKEEDVPEPFRWRAYCEMTYENWIIGRFRSLGSSRIDGLFRLKFRSYAQMIVGNWMGSSYDNEHTYGALVLGRSEHDARRCFRQECEGQPALPLAR